jgi:hypothetical protein
MNPAPSAVARRWIRGLAAALAAGGVLIAQPAAAQDRPISAAPYRYSPAPTRPLNSLEQQKAYSYRNELSAQQRGMLTDRTLNRDSGGNAASFLRRQGELTGESSRMDRVLQR